MVKVGMISFAHMHAYSYASCLKELPNAEIVAIYNEDTSVADDLCRRFGGKFFDDYHKLLEEDLDAVIVCSANADHREHVTAAAEAGKAVLCEKPIATTVEDGQEMIEACEKAGVKFGIAFPCRYIPAVRRAKEAVESGQIGRIIGIKGTNHGSMPGGWFAQKEKSGGGAVMDHTVHVVDLWRWFLKSEVVEVYAESDTLMHQIEVDDCGILTLLFDNGVFATLDASWSRPKSFPTWGDVTMEIVGVNGVISLDAFAQDFDLYNDKVMKAQWIYWGDNMDMGLISDFIESIEEDRPFMITGEDGLRALEVALAAYRSAETHEPVKLR
ncbi:Gfo/Idh/MocA family oxidoreductase [Candidatus Poribacteria bacterium]|nr:Gfo/Idh/MocA family oxidoreductase [Candidatus Poribacteria bacterium]